MNLFRRLVLAVPLLVGLSLGLIQPTNAQQAGGARKPMVIVREIRDQAGTGQADEFKTMLQTAIAQSGRFRVVESDYSTLVDEQNTANSGMTRSRTPGQTGGFEKGDFIISGSITGGGAGVTQSDNSGAILAGRIFGISGLGGGIARGQFPAWRST